MGQYVARKRARFYSGGRQVNIPWGAVLDEQDGSLYWQGRPLCRISSQNAYDYFSRNDDGNGKLRGQLVGAILSRLERRDANYQARWDRVWESPLCQPYKRPEHEDWWVWNYAFYNAPNPDLQRIAALVGAKRR